MFTIHNRLWSQVAACCLFAMLMGVAARPASAVPPPPMPTTFDRTTVQSLVDAIDEKHNASILKVGYFMHRGNAELAPVEGLELVKSALQKEQIGSKRWFALQLVIGFAGLRVSGASTGEALSAYDAIFDQATKVPGVAATPILVQAIHEYVFSVLGRYHDLHVPLDVASHDRTLKAWDAYVLAAGSMKITGREPAWADVIEDSFLNFKMMPRIEKLIADPQSPKTYGILMTSAAVLASDKPLQAIAVLEGAKSFLPSQDAAETKRLYGSLVELLKQVDKTKEAVKAQQEMIELTGQGRGPLAVMLWRNKDKSAFLKVLSELNGPVADEREINWVGGALLKLYREDTESNQKVAEAAEKLLTQYLAGPRKRQIEEELSARLILSEFLMRQQRRDEARLVLNVGDIAQQLKTERARSNYASIQRKIEAMDRIQKRSGK